MIIHKLRIITEFILLIVILTIMFVKFPLELDQQMQILGTI